MDLSTLEQKQRAERYLFGRLTAPEAHEFEQQIRKSPALLDRLDIGAVVDRGRYLIDDALPADAAAATTARRRWLIPGLTTCLGITLIIIMMLYVTAHRLTGQNERLEAEIQQGRLVAPTRAAGALLSPGLPNEHVPLYELGSRNSPTLTDLHIDLSKSKATRYRVTIKRADGTYWARFDNQIKDSDGALRLTLNSGAFTVGTYTTLIEAVDLFGRTSPAGELALRVN